MLGEIKRVEVFSTTVYYSQSQITQHKQATWVFKCLPIGLEIAFYARKYLQLEESKIAAS